eukprot:scaffold66929_cov29-Phaeocystis_antarctica.AAC.3
MKHCSSLPPFYRKHRFTRQDSQATTNTNARFFLTLRVTLDNQNVCLLSRVSCLVVAGAEWIRPFTGEERQHAPPSTFFMTPAKLELDDKEAIRTLSST